MSAGSGGRSVDHVRQCDESRRRLRALRLTARDLMEKLNGKLDDTMFFLATRWPRPLILVRRRPRFGHPQSEPPRSDRDRVIESINLSLTQRPSVKRHPTTVLSHHAKNKPPDAAGLVSAIASRVGRSRGGSGLHEGPSVGGGAFWNLPGALRATHLCEVCVQCLLVLDASVHEVCANIYIEIYNANTSKFNI